ncbi:MAG TPA: hypothetical protein VLA97_14815 [Nocardioidaceae bacterium]|nr:hypothetical protein [Nocardioidaceae bacterium]
MPADRVAERTAELEPVFARLVEVQEMATRIRDEAGREADRRRQEAAERGRALVASAHRQAEVERATAPLRAAREAEDQAAATLASAERDVAALRCRTTDRLPELVDRALSAVRAAMAPQGPDP